jgi:hypothetical protein
VVGEAKVARPSVLARETEQGVVFKQRCRHPCCLNAPMRTGITRSLSDHAVPGASPGAACRRVSDLRLVSEGSTVSLAVTPASRNAKLNDSA